MLLVAAAGFSLALVLAVWAVLSQAQERAVIRSSLRQLEGYDAPVESIREQELLAPLRDRAVVPMLKAFTDVGRRFAPAGYVEQARQKLIHAGKIGQQDLDRFLALRVGCLALVPVWFFFAFTMLHLGGSMKLVVFALLTLCSVLGPDAILNRKVAERQLTIR